MHSLSSTLSAFLVKISNAAVSNEQSSKKIPKHSGTSTVPIHRPGGINTMGKSDKAHAYTLKSHRQSEISTWKQSVHQLLTASDRGLKMKTKKRKTDFLRVDHRCHQSTYCGIQLPCLVHHILGLQLHLQDSYLSEYRRNSR